MMRAKRLILSLLLLAATLTVRASDKAMLIEMEQRSDALPNGVSATGAVVVGSRNSGGGFYWMPTTGAIFIGGLGATMVSGDGRTIVGQAFDTRGLLSAAIWLRAAEWKQLGHPVMVGASRKSFIGSLVASGNAAAAPEARLYGSLAVAAWCHARRVEMVRVHDVRETVELFRILDAIEDPAPFRPKG